jgi:hypothetical protein
LLRECSCILHARDSSSYREKQAEVKAGGGFAHDDERTAD